MSRTSSLAEVVEKLENTNNKAVAFVIRQPNHPDDAPSILVAINMEDIHRNLLTVKEGIEASAEKALEIIALDMNGKQLGDQGRVFLNQGKLWIAWDGPEKTDPYTNISDVAFSLSEDVQSNIRDNRLKAADQFIGTLSPIKTSIRRISDSRWIGMKPDSLFQEVNVQSPSSSVVKTMNIILDFKPESSVIKCATLDDRRSGNSWDLDIPEPTESNDNSADDGPGL